MAVAVVVFVIHVPQRGIAATVATNSIAVQIAKFPNGYHSRLWDDFAVFESSTNAVSVPRNNRGAVLKQLLPWFKRVFSEEYVPADMHNMSMYVIPGKQGHEIFKLIYERDNIQVTILDTCGALMFTVRDRQIHLGNAESIATKWQGLIRRFMRKTERYDSPQGLNCSQDLDTIYIYPIYPEISRAIGTGKECWWGNLDTDYKIADGLFRVAVMKRIDGEHLVDSDCDFPNRYERLGN
jgi:hypothetical protein